MKTLIDLEDDDCRWPCGDLYCGEPRRDRKTPYCAAHAKEAGKPIPPRKTAGYMPKRRGRGGWLPNR